MLFNNDWENQTCKDCRYFKTVKDQKKVLANQPKLFECRRNPPQTLALLIPQQNGIATQLTVVYPRMPENFPACANYLPNVADEN